MDSDFYIVSLVNILFKKSESSVS